MKFNKRQLLKNMKKSNNRVKLNKWLLENKHFEAATRLYQKLLIHKDYIILRFDNADWLISLAAEELKLKNYVDFRGLMTVYF